MTTDIKIPLEVNDIQRIIPHRYPFLFVDRIIEFVDGVKIVGVKNVSVNEPFFEGHFPGRPLMPGVLILEALAQVGAIFVKISTGGASAEKLIVFSGVESARFRKPVVPGDVITLECSSPRRKLVHWKMRAIARVGDQVVADAILKATEVN